MNTVARNPGVVRMMNQTVKVLAVLVQDVSYFKKGEEISYTVGTEVMVDPCEGVAFYNGDHFDIGLHEYKVKYLN